MLADIPPNHEKLDILRKGTSTKRWQSPSVLPVCVQQKATSRWSLDLRRRDVSKRSCFLGVETSEELLWEGWEFGRELTKSLALKNVHGKVQKLSFRPPLSKFFTTLFPQTIVLSPGTSFSLPITFRPLERCEYTDNIEFQSPAGSFQVSLRATIPRHTLEMPESVLLPPCAVLHDTQTSFLLCNASKLRTGFAWKVCAPFSLSPESGVLDPGEVCRMTVLFKPQRALVYREEASCVFGDKGESRCSVLLQGISKYPHLQLVAPGREDGCSVLQFGSVAVGSSLEKHFHVLNPSEVSALFRLTLVSRPALLESVFQCQVREGCVGPGSTARVPLRFSPQTVDCISVDYFSLSCPGGVSKAMLKVTGSCLGPLLSLEESVLDFGCVTLGEEVTRTVQLLNSSPVEAFFQFDAGAAGHSVFALDPPCGTVLGNGYLAVRVRFRPCHPIAHHKRVCCLVLHREPLFLDLIGTCHSEQLKPAILSARHLCLYRLHLARGLTCYPPDILSVMLAEKKLQLDHEGALMFPENPLESRPVSSTPALEMTPMEEYFQQSGDAPPSPAGPHVTLDPPELLFQVDSGSLPLSLTNHTKGKLTLLWTTAPGSPFSISPVSCDLAPLKSTAFRVTYAPQEENVLHGAQLECFALYKVLRDHRQVDHQQVDHRTLCPPWCVTVRVSGHSFQPGREHFIPRYSLQRPQVVFPALPQVYYRTVLLQNTGDLPLTFRLDVGDFPPVCVRPTSGLVLPGDHQIIALKSMPAEDGPRNLLLFLQFNATPKHTQALAVTSVAEKLRATLEGNGRLFFKPTAVGSCSQRSCWVKNTSRTPFHFQWRVRGPYDRVLSVSPDRGLLQPNESMVQTWSFTPLAEMLYTLKPSLTFWPTRSPNCRKSRLSLRVVGVASQGSIQAECPVLDLGEVLVGSCQSCDLPLLNNGSCPINFFLAVKQCVVGQELSEDVDRDPLALELECLRGTLPARSRMLIRASVRPARRAQYCWSISYQIPHSTGKEEECSSMPGFQALCQVKGEGVYPTFSVTDARGGGSAGVLSKLHLWGLFSLNALNAYLCRDPSPPELTYRVPTRHSLRRCPAIFTSAILDFNFGAAPLGSDPSSVLLLFKNMGSILVEWSFLFPEDQHIELEYWAESGEFSPTELQQMRVQENRLFSVRPRAGKLQPGQQRAVQLTYRHNLAGIDRLPVLLKLSHGREILLNFVGVTVKRDRPYIHFTSSKHTFNAVAIGGFNPPQQTYELYNGGAVPVSYHIDTAPLDRLTEDNFGHPVLRCLNPSGEVEPGCMAYLEWVFSPLEAKTYSVDIPIHVMEGDTALVTFEGCGLDSRAVGDTPPILHNGNPRSVLLPGQIVYLSEEQLSLGDVPVCSRATRILFLTNVSSTERVLYTWSLADHHHKEALQIHPECGELAAGESALFILTLKTCGSPCFYLLDLICQVTPQSAQTQYLQELQQWEQERERQKYEFTLTERETQEPERPQGCATSSRETCVAVRKYKTLPPIGSSRRGEGARADVPRASPLRAPRQGRGENAWVWRRPQPARPTLLHLGVTARSHSLPEFQNCFASRLNTHYVQRTPQPKVPLHPQPAEGPTFVHGPEREIVTHALMSILRNLLDDPQFHRSLAEGSADPVPYFTQLRSPQRPPIQPPCPGATSLPAASDHEGLFAANPLGAEPDTSSPLPNLQGAWQTEQQLKVRETIRRLPEFGDLVEDVLLNMLQNLMMEAFLGELVLTTRPRVIALPPCSPRSGPPAAPPGSGSPDTRLL